jgi:hypothetical protein
MAASSAAPFFIWRVQFTFLLFWLSLKTQLVLFSASDLGSVSRLGWLAREKWRIPMKYFAYGVLGSLLVFASVQSASVGRASAQAQAKASLDELKLPEKTVFLAKLSANLDGRQCKPGDPVEAEVRQDIKQGHDILLKKGSALLGHVAGVKVPTSDTPQLTVAIVFDSVRMKDGKQLLLNLIIQALAPEADLDNSSSLADFAGPVTTKSTSTAGVSGHNSTVNGSINRLTATSTGVYDLKGLALSDQTTNGAHYSTLASTTGEFRLKKGAQLVMKVVSQ